MKDYIDIAKDYFKDDLPSLEPYDRQYQDQGQDNLVDEIILAHRSTIIDRLLKSRASLIKKCDDVIKNGKEYFKDNLKCKMEILENEHEICEYPGVSEGLQEYLNNTYDSIKKRFSCEFEYDCKDKYTGFMIIELRDFY